MLEPARPPVRRIVLAVDMTAASQAAAQTAIDRARDEAAELIVISVVDRQRPHLPGTRPSRVDQERERLAAGAQAIVRQAREAGVRATYLIWEGEPADAILEASASEGASLIVMGARRRTNFRRLILGSVSTEVARRAACEVLIVPG